MHLSTINIPGFKQEESIMSKGENQRLKLYYLYKIMVSLTDDEHSITVEEIINELDKFGISAERKSIYRDLETLNDDFKLEIIRQKEGRQHYYHVGSKQFEIAELKLLVDAVQSSKFITERKSANLIKKLTEFASIYEAGQLKRQVHVRGRIKTMNESIFYNVDEIYNAMNDNKRIHFQYMQWSFDKKLIPKTDNNSDEIKIYDVSPWAFTWDDENYYLVAFDHETKSIRHYRVDKMDRILKQNEKREGKDQFKDFDPAGYIKKTFGMFQGHDEKVRIELKNYLIGVFIDRFGKDISIFPSDREGYSTTIVDVSVSSQFFGWLFALGDDVKILSPKNVIEEYQKEMQKVIKIY